MITANLSEKIIELQKVGFSDFEIIQNMKLQGFDIAEINATLDSLNAQRSADVKAKHLILSNQFVPLILLVFTYLLFFHLIPPAIAESFDILFAILGGAICMVLCLWAGVTSTFKPFEKAPIFFGIISVLSLFIFGGFFIFKTTDYASQQIKDNGKTAIARVIDNTRIIGRRGKTMCSIEVEFLSISNKTEHATIDVSEEEYRSFVVGTELPVIYSAENPGIAQIDFNGKRH